MPNRNLVEPTMLPSLKALFEEIVRRHANGLGLWNDAKALQVGFQDPTDGSIFAVPLSYFFSHYHFGRLSPSHLHVARYQRDRALAMKGEMPPDPPPPTDASWQVREIPLPSGNIAIALTR